MKFTQHVQNHIKNIDFSSSLEVVYSGHDKKLLSRTRILTEKIRGKNIIHIGCGDHLPLIKNKITHNTWLHKILHGEANLCIGIDNNENVINYIKKDFAIENVYCIDITSTDVILPDSISNNKWDYILLGEMLEHISNPVFFLESLKSIFVNNTKKIIVTVPNSFSLTNIKNTFFNRESVNSDHRYWFSPYTLAKTLHDAGFSASDYTFCELFDYEGMTWKGRLKHSLLCSFFIRKYFPGLRDTLLMEADF
jgi:2-polyprenyl-3-methyl-5-hydroxy-6-metoxy-1,4-benzoquinol methylase